MLSGHLADAHIGSDDDHGVVGHETHEAEHGRFEVLFVTAQVQESNQVLRVLSNVGPGLVLVRVHVFHLNLLIFFVETHNLLSDTRGSTVCRLMTEVENLLTSGASSVIHDALCKNTDHGTLS